MLRDASNGDIDEYAEAVTEFIQKCVEDGSTKINWGYTNKKTWMKNTIKAETRRWRKRPI